MKKADLRKRAVSVAAAAVMTVSAAVGTTANVFDFGADASVMTVYAAESSVKVLSSKGYGEGVYATWSSVSGASGYNVYVDGTQIDSMLIFIMFLDTVSRNAHSTLVSLNSP